MKNRYSATATNYFSTSLTFVVSVAALNALVACTSTPEDAKSPESQAAVRLNVAPKEDPTAHNTNVPDAEGTRIRQASIAKLELLGFRAAESLPTTGHRRDVAGKLRPANEIAGRLLAMKAITTYVIAPEDQASTSGIRKYVERNQLERLMSAKERSILQMDRSTAREQHGATVGWYFENMWALAWVLGYQREPGFVGGMIPDDVIREVVFDFAPGPDIGSTDFAAGSKLRSRAEVASLEDAFYCAHNAVRSAQIGSADTVPSGFDPVADGGVIHERRHSLTWVLSPGVAWDDTDLST
jgi:hypothetical protein